MGHAHFESLFIGLSVGHAHSGSLFIGVSVGHAQGGSLFVGLSVGHAWCGSLFIGLSVLGMLRVDRCLSSVCKCVSNTLCHDNQCGTIESKTGSPIFQFND